VDRLNAAIKCASDASALLSLLTRRPSRPATPAADVEAAPKPSHDPRNEDADGLPTLEDALAATEPDAEADAEAEAAAAAGAATDGMGSRGLTAEAARASTARLPRPEPDWTLRDELTFTTAVPWTWLPANDPATSAAALAAFAVGTPASAAPPDRAWYQQLLYWAYPTQLPPPSFASQINHIMARKARGGAASLTSEQTKELQHAESLLREWYDGLAAAPRTAPASNAGGSGDCSGSRARGRHAAFRSLYYAYRHGHCPYFYVRSARHTAVFYKVGAEWRAAMARSNHEFRKILHEDGAYGRQHM